jgi:hypothetical protein
MFRLDFVDPDNLSTPGPTGLERQVEKLWQRHVVQNRLFSRMVRAAACVLLTLILTVCIVLAFGETRFVPQRGVLALRVHEVLHVLAFLMLYFVVFFVADASALCVSFLRHLRREQSVWPDATLRRFGAKLGFDNVRLIDHWIDLQFLAERTAAINRLVYYPFIVLSLVLLSRSPVFDDWTMPLSGKVLAALGALIAFACAVALRQAAERSRKAALKEIDDTLIQASGQAGGPQTQAKIGDAAAPTASRAGDLPPQAQFAPPTMRQLELLRDHVARLNQGAFAPYSEQPLLKALLLPFATVGGASLLEYLRLANL